MNQVVTKLKNGPKCIESVPFYQELAGSYDSLAKIKGLFPSAGYMFSKIHPFMNAAGATSVVDIGIGTGLSSLPFAKEGYYWVTGIDGSENMLQICRHKQVAHELFKCDFETAAALPLVDGGYDAAISTNTFYLLRPTRQLFLIGEMQRAVGKGGYFGFDYEVCDLGQISVRFNDATFSSKGPKQVVATYKMHKNTIDEALDRLGCEVVSRDVRVAGQKLSGHQIVFETVICHKPG